jgi:AraC-like DNA-binding protein
VVAALRLSRPTVYRLFQHEGGLASYIRNLRLRHAADELAKHSNAMVAEIAYGAGFKSASDFTRAFRRAFDMAPQDFRAAARKAD